MFVLNSYVIVYGFATALIN